MRFGVRWSVMACALMLACTTLQYKDDLGFLVSAQAGSAEFPVFINGHICTDLEGRTGLCAKRIKSTEDVVISFEAQPYAYRLTVACTTGVTPVEPATVPAKTPYQFVIPHDAFMMFRSFDCIGEVSPQDRTPPISAEWNVLFSVVDTNYVTREKMFIQTKGKETFLVLGQFARDSVVFDEGKWTTHSKDTIVKIKGRVTDVRARSSSYAMRFNEYPEPGR